MDSTQTPRVPLLAGPAVPGLPNELRTAGRASSGTPRRSKAFDMSEQRRSSLEWGAGPRRSRRGTAVVESAIVLSVCFMMMMGTLDLGLAVVQYNALSRRGAAAGSNGNGTRIDGRAADDDLGTDQLPGHRRCDERNGDGPAAAAGLHEPERRHLDAELARRDTATGDRVQVKVSYVHKSLVPFLSYGGQIKLSASSTMALHTKFDFRTFMPLTRAPVPRFAGLFATLGRAGPIQ